MSNQAPDPNQQRRRSRVHGIHIALGVVVVVIAIIAVGAFSTANTAGSRNTTTIRSAAAGPLGAAMSDMMCEDGVCAGSPGMTCFTLDEGCNEPIISPWDALQGLKTILAALKSIDPGASCQMSSTSGQQMAKCITKGGTENVPIPNQKPPSPSPGGAGKLVAWVGNTTVFAGSPSTAVQATLQNTGTDDMVVAAEFHITATTCGFALPSVPGLEISPETVSAVNLPAGATLTIPLSVKADSTVPLGLYQICLNADASAIGGPLLMEADATGTATVADLPIQVDQSGMPSPIAAGDSWVGTIKLTNASPAEPVNVTVKGQLAPASQVQIYSVSLENGQCNYAIGGTSYTCTALKMDAESTLDLQINFSPSQSGTVTSSATVTSGNVPGMFSTQNITVTSN